MTTGISVKASELPEAWRKRKLVKPDECLELHELPTLDDMRRWRVRTAKLENLGTLYEFEVPKRLLKRLDGLGR